MLRCETLLAWNDPISTRRNQRRAAQSQQPPPVQFLNRDNAETLRQYANGMQQRHRDAFPLNDNLIAQFFIIQSNLSDLHTYICIYIDIRIEIEEKGIYGR